MAKVVFVLFFSCLSYASDFRYTYPGMRANSIGTAFSSIADDPFAIFYNPAGLNQIKTWEIGATLNRKLSQKNLGEFTLGYIRPIPELKDGVFGFGFDAVRQSQEGKMDNYIFSYSNQISLKYFQYPVLYGANIRITSIRYPWKSHFGLGFDAGILLRSVNKYNLSVVLSRFMFGLGQNLTTLSVGCSYEYLDTIFAADLRATGGYSEIFYGIERKLNSDLLRLRIGKGGNLDGKDFMMVGVGVNFDPLIIDVGFSYPYKGLHLNAGNYGISLTYKFTGPTYYERMYNETAQKAFELENRVKTLTEQADALEKTVKTYESQKNILETDITVLRTKIIELNDEIRKKENELADIEFEKRKPKEQQKEQMRKSAMKTDEKWPKYHKVEKGDTLRSISSKYYGTPNMWKIIYQENEDKIFKGLPKEGEVLVIPPPKNE